MKHKHADMLLEVEMAKSAAYYAAAALDDFDALFAMLEDPAPAAEPAALAPLVALALPKATIASALAEALVLASMASLADTLKTFRWDGIRLVISRGKPDKRRSFFKTIEKAGSVEMFAALSADDRDATFNDRV